MIELILAYSPCGGVFTFDGLPETMRLVYINTPKYGVKSVLVNYMTLPKSVKRLMLCTSSLEKIEKKVMEIGEPNGVELKIRGTYVGIGKISKYMKAFEDKLWCKS